METKFPHHRAFADFKKKEARIDLFYQGLFLSLPPTLLSCETACMEVSEFSDREALRSTLIAVYPVHRLSASLRPFHHLKVIIGGSEAMDLSPRDASVLSYNIHVLLSFHSILSSFLKLEFGSRRWRRAGQKEWGEVVETCMA